VGRRSGRGVAIWLTWRGGGDGRNYTGEEGRPEREGRGGTIKEAAVRGTMEIEQENLKAESLLVSSLDRERRTAGT